MDLTQNYFELFELPLQFPLNRDALDKAFRALQRQHHPDRFAHKSEAEQRVAVQYSAWLNTAYETLKDPLLRAQYLLSLQGIETGEEARNALPVEFLMEQMLLREQLAELSKSKDPFEALEALEGQVDSMAQAAFSAFQQCYENRDYVVSELWIRKLQFISKLQQEISALDQRLNEEL